METADIVTMETQKVFEDNSWLETKLVVMDQNQLCNHCCHGRFQCQNLHDDKNSRCHSDGAIRKGHFLQNKEVGNKTSQLYRMYDAVVNSETHYGCHGNNQCCCTSGKFSGQGSMPRSKPRSQQKGHCQISVCIGAKKEQLKQSCHLERCKRPPSGQKSKSRDSSADAAQSHNSKSNPATRCRATIKCSESVTRGRTASISSSSPRSANQKPSCSPSSSSPWSVTSSGPPPRLMTSLIYAVILLLSVMSQNVPVLAQEPEWITEPSDTKIPEFGTQTLYCRIRNRGNRAIAWIQYHRNGDVRNLFIDDARWAAPDR